MYRSVSSRLICTLIALFSLIPALPRLSRADVVRSEFFDQSGLQGGLYDEIHDGSAVILSNGDGFPPMLNLHYSIIENLPVGVHAIVLYPESRGGQKAAEKAYGPVLSKVRPGTVRFIITSGNMINWGRDFLPEFVFDASGKTSLVQFRYSRMDQGATEEMMHAAGGLISKEFGLPLEFSRIRLEGGNLLAAPEGRLFLTEKVLLANKDIARSDIENEIKALLKIREIHWMPMLPEETTGHIDIFAKYVGKNTILVASSERQTQAKVLDDSASRFQGLGYRIIRIPNAPSDLASLTYTNSLIVNGTAFIPSYATNQLPKKSPLRRRIEAADKQAAEVYRSLGFRVISVPMMEAIFFGGAIHCMTKLAPEIGKGEEKKGQLRFGPAPPWKS